MRKELKGLEGKVAIHCTTPEEVDIIGGLLELGEHQFDWAKRQLGDGEQIAIDEKHSGYLEYYTRHGYTILPASDFIALNTDQPDKEPAWIFKTDEELAEMMIAYHDQVPSKRKSALDFLTSIRTPAFSFVTSDNVTVTNPKQTVWREIGAGLADAKWALENPTFGPYFTTEQAALTHRHQSTPAIKLSDMTLENDYYWIWKEDAHNLVNERIK